MLFAGRRSYCCNKMSVKLLTPSSGEYSHVDHKIQLISITIFCRMDTHRAVLEAAKRKLSEMMKSMSPESLQLLLACSFPYVGVPELRDIPLAVLAQLQPVPPDFLLQLSKDKELFADLPSTVQIQVDTPDNDIDSLNGGSELKLKGFSPRHHLLCPTVLSQGGNLCVSARLLSSYDHPYKRRETPFTSSSQRAWQRSSLPRVSLWIPF